LDAAAKLAGHRIDAVVASPFKRCLQTSAGVVRGLPGFSEDGNHSSSRQWLVDWAVAEVRHNVTCSCQQSGVACTLWLG
jgi:phosphohistidine phosphatase SixA